MSTLAADPYYFNTSRHLDKAEFVEKDVESIKLFLGKSEVEIFNASKAYIGREEHLFLFTSAMRFWRNAIEVQLTSQSTNLSTLVTVFCAESLLGAQITGNSDRFRNFILNYLSRNEKIELLSGYCFGTPYQMGRGRFRKKHLCHRAVIRSFTGNYTNRSYCSSGEAPICGCRDWLNQASDKKINHYLNMLGTHFYWMRNSVVHDAGYVQFTSMPFESEGLGMIVPTMLDAYSNNSRKQYTSYDTDIALSRFHEMMKNAAWRCFESGSKVRFYKQVKPLERL